MPQATRFSLVKVQALERLCVVLTGVCGIRVSSWTIFKCHVLLSSIKDKEFDRFLLLCFHDFSHIIMIIRVSSIALGASIILNAPFVLTLSPSDIPSDTPIASLVSSAKANLAQGKSNDALTYFDVAVSRDPNNYLTIFQRGATYLSLGQNVKANEDFDKVLSIKPGFEGALLQRAKIKSRNADWEGAKKDYQTAKKLDSADFNELLEAEGAATLAKAAAEKGDWEGCVSQAGTAIMVASTTLSLRQLRAKCRFERGEILEGLADLQHVLQIAPRSTEPHLQISSTMFYALGETEKGLQQIRKCLHSDPDSKVCSKLHKRMKKLDKVMKQLDGLKQKKQWNSLAKLLVGSGEETGLVDDVKQDVKEAREMGRIPEKAPNELYVTFIELACEAYTEVRPYLTPTKFTVLTGILDEQQEEGPPIL